MKKGFSLVEIGFVLIIITAVFFAVVPFSVSNIKQAKLISDWKNYIEQVNYSFETLIEYKKYNSLDEKQSVERLLKYLDAKVVYDDSVIKKYKYKMMNSKFYEKTNATSFDSMSVDSSGRYIGVKYNTSCTNNETCTQITVDLNGKKKPNKMGNDIFIYEVYEDSIKPYGSGSDFGVLMEDCENGTGMMCSQYYLLGGD